MDNSKNSMNNDKSLCLYCDKAFSNINDQENHVERDHKAVLKKGSLRKSERITKNSSLENSPFTACFYCNNKKIIKSEDLESLFQHLLTAHKDIYFGCKCRTRLLDKVALTNHRKNCKIGGGTKISKASSSSVVAEDGEKVTEKRKTAKKLQSKSNVDVKCDNNSESESISNAALACSATTTTTTSKNNSVKTTNAINKKSDRSNVKNSNSNCNKSNSNANLNDKRNKNNNSSSSSSSSSSSNNNKNISSSSSTVSSSSRNSDEYTIPLTRQKLKEPSTSKSQSQQQQSSHSASSSSSSAASSSSSSTYSSSQNRSTSNSANNNNNNNSSGSNKKSQKNGKTSSSASEKSASSSNASPTKVQRTKSTKVINQNAQNSCEAVEASQKNEIINAEFDDDFYKNISCNIRANLNSFIDGKIDRLQLSKPAFDRISAGEGDAGRPRIFKQEQQQHLQPQQQQQQHKQKQHQQNSNDLSKTHEKEIHESTNFELSTPFPALLTVEQYGFGDANPNKNKRHITKNSWKWKWDLIKKYKYVNEGGKIVKKVKQITTGLKDLSQLDMWTQLSMRSRYESLNSQSGTDEFVDGLNDSLSTRTIKTQNLEQLNNILDKRLQPEINIEQLQQTLVKEELVESDCVDGADEQLPNEETANDSEVLGMFKLMRTNASKVARPALSGEWARPRCFVCVDCGQEFDLMKSLNDHKNSEHPYVVSAHYEVVGRENLEQKLYRNLFLPKKALQLSANAATKSLSINSDSKSNDATSTSESSSNYLTDQKEKECTKCMKMIKYSNDIDIYRHILDCIEDRVWLQAKKRSKYRRSRRKTKKNMRKSRLSTDQKKSTSSPFQKENPEGENSSLSISNPPTPKDDKKPAPVAKEKKESFISDGAANNGNDGMNIKSFFRVSKTTPNLPQKVVVQMIEMQPNPLNSSLRHSLRSSAKKQTNGAAAESDPKQHQQQQQQEKAQNSPGKSAAAASQSDSIEVTAVKKEEKEEEKTISKETKTVETQDTNEDESKEDALKVETTHCAVTSQLPALSISECEKSSPLLSPTSSALISPTSTSSSTVPKKKKKLNDCIAMLTCKIQEKLGVNFFENASTEIFPPDGAPKQEAEEPKSSVSQPSPCKSFHAATPLVPTVSASPIVPPLAPSLPLPPSVCDTEPAKPAPIKFVCPEQDEVIDLSVKKKPEKEQEKIEFPSLKDDDHEKAVEIAPHAEKVDGPPKVDEPDTKKTPQEKISEVVQEPLELKRQPTPEPKSIAPKPSKVPTEVKTAEQANQQEVVCEPKKDDLIDVSEIKESFKISISKDMIPNLDEILKENHVITVNNLKISDAERRAFEEQKNRIMQILNKSKKSAAKKQTKKAPAPKKAAPPSKKTNAAENGGRGEEEEQKGKEEVKVVESDAEKAADVSQPSSQQPRVEEKTPQEKEKRSQQEKEEEEKEKKEDTEASKDSKEKTDTAANEPKENEKSVKSDEDRVESIETTAPKFEFPKSDDTPTSTDSNIESKIQAAIKTTNRIRCRRLSVVVDPIIHLSAFQQTNRKIRLTNNSQQNGFYDLLTNDQLFNAIKPQLKDEIQKSAKSTGKSTIKEAIEEVFSKAGKSKASTSKAPAKTATKAKSKPKKTGKRRKAKFSTKKKKKKAPPTATKAEEKKVEIEDDLKQKEAEIVIEKAPSSTAKKDQPKSKQLSAKAQTPAAESVKVAELPKDNQKTEIKPDQKLDEKKQPTEEKLAPKKAPTKSKPPPKEVVTLVSAPSLPPPPPSPPLPPTPTNKEEKPDNKNLTKGKQPAKKKAESPKKSQSKAKPAKETVELEKTEIVDRAFAIASEPKEKDTKKGVDKNSEKPADTPEVSLITPPTKAKVKAHSKQDMNKIDEKLQATPEVSLIQLPIKSKSNKIQSKQEANKVEAEKRELDSTPQTPAKKTAAKSKAPSKSKTAAKKPKVSSSDKMAKEDEENMILDVSLSSDTSNENDIPLAKLITATQSVEKEVIDVSKEDTKSDTEKSKSAQSKAKSKKKSATPKKDSKKKNAPDSPEPLRTEKEETIEKEIPLLSVESEILKVDRVIEKKAAVEELPVEIAVEKIATKGTKKKEKKEIATADVEVKVIPQKKTDLFVVNDDSFFNDDDDDNDIDQTDKKINDLVNNIINSSELIDSESEKNEKLVAKEKEKEKREGPRCLVCNKSFCDERGLRKHYKTGTHLMKEEKERKEREEREKRQKEEKEREKQKEREAIKASETSASITLDEIKIFRTKGALKTFDNILPNPSSNHISEVKSFDQSKEFKPLNINECSIPDVKEFMPLTMGKLPLEDVDVDDDDENDDLSRKDKIFDSLFSNIENKLQAAAANAPMPTAKFEFPSLTPQESEVESSSTSWDLQHDADIEWDADNNDNNQPSLALTKEKPPKKASKPKETAMSIPTKSLIMGKIFKKHRDREKQKTPQADAPNNKPGIKNSLDEIFDHLKNSAEIDDKVLTCPSPKTLLKSSGSTFSPQHSSDMIETASQSNNNNNNNNNIYSNKPLFASTPPPKETEKAVGVAAAAAAAPSKSSDAKVRKEGVSCKQPKHSNDSHTTTTATTTIDDDDEDAIGVRKSRRRCAIKTKTFAETWSSDEYEELHDTNDIISIINEIEKRESNNKRRKSSKSESQSADVSSIPLRKSVEEVETKPLNDHNNHHRDHHDHHHHNHHQQQQQQPPPHNNHQQHQQLLQQVQKAVSKLKSSETVVDKKIAMPSYSSSCSNISDKSEKKKSVQLQFPSIEAYDKQKPSSALKKRRMSTLKDGHKSDEETFTATKDLKPLKPTLSLKKRRMSCFVPSTAFDDDPLPPPPPSKVQPFRSASRNNLNSSSSHEHVFNKKFDKSDHAGSAVDEKCGKKKVLALCNSSSNSGAGGALASSHLVNSHSHSSSNNNNNHSSTSSNSTSAKKKAQKHRKRPRTKIKNIAYDSDSDFELNISNKKSKSASAFSDSVSEDEDRDAEEEHDDEVLPKLESKALAKSCSSNSNELTMIKEPKLLPNDLNVVPAATAHAAIPEDIDSLQSAGNRTKRHSSEKLYYWSSSSSESDLEGDTADGENEDSMIPQQPEQHGWIVGDSHKKLVTLLAHAKIKNKIN